MAILWYTETRIARLQIEHAYKKHVYLLKEDILLNVHSESVVSSLSLFWVGAQSMLRPEELQYEGNFRNALKQTRPVIRACLL